MLVIEYDHRSLKALPHLNSPGEFHEMLKLVDIIKRVVPQAIRTYNPETKVWFITEPYLKLVREQSGHLDLSWEKRL